MGGCPALDQQHKLLPAPLAARWPLAMLWAPYGASRQKMGCFSCLGRWGAGRWCGQRLSSAWCFASAVLLEAFRSPALGALLGCTRRDLFFAGSARVRQQHQNPHSLPGLQRCPPWDSSWAGNPAVTQASSRRNCRCCLQQWVQIFCLLITFLSLPVSFRSELSSQF